MADGKMRDLAKLNEWSDNSFSIDLSSLVPSEWKRKTEGEEAARTDNVSVFIGTLTVPAEETIPNDAIISLGHVHSNDGACDVRCGQVTNLSYGQAMALALHQTSIEDNIRREEAMDAVRKRMDEERKRRDEMMMKNMEEERKERNELIQRLLSGNGNNNAFANTATGTPATLAPSTPTISRRLFVDTRMTTPSSNRWGRAEVLGTVIKTLQDVQAKDEEEQEVSTCFII